MSKGSAIHPRRNVKKWDGAEYWKRLAKRKKKEKSET